jgi:hypothetical protein
MGALSLPPNCYASFRAPRADSPDCRRCTAPELLVEYTHYDYSLDRASPKQESERCAEAMANLLKLTALSVALLVHTVWSVGCTFGTMVSLLDDLRTGEA